MADAERCEIDAFYGHQDRTSAAFIRCHDRFVDGAAELVGTMNETDRSVAALGLERTGRLRKQAY